MSEMLKELAKYKEEVRTVAKSGGEVDPGTTEELPEGTSPIEASEAAPETQAAPSEEASAEASGEVAPAEPVKLIRIGDREFSDENSAIEYARELERKSAEAELYNQGVRDALEASRRGEQSPAEKPPEDNFDERFYTNPKEALKEIQTKARDEAVAIIRQEQTRERLWSEFLNENPDIRRKDAERVLSENWETIGRMTDLRKAQATLAQKVRAEYDEIRDLGKPRTELKNKPVQVLSPSGGAPKSVTPKKNDDAPLTLTQQLRRLKEHR